ncbi:UMP kinase [Patescibacteria group bacterium]|nr:UMP kinase [Patescibacteria group bacterium]
MKIISVGGSIIIPKNGFNIPFLKKFRELILRRVKKGEKFVLIIGGGATCRQYQAALAKSTKVVQSDLDWLGISATKLNAHFVRLLFGGHAYKDIMSNPYKKIITKKSIIIASGWKPGNSTDTGAVRFAKTYGAKEVINLSNIEYVYDKDPNKHKSAKKIEKIDWKSFRKIVGNKWVAGANEPFDPVASREAEKLGLKVSILKGADLKEVDNVLSGKEFRGTVIR